MVVARAGLPGGAMNAIAFDSAVVLPRSARSSQGACLR
jgi:hypothetical protein